MYSYKDFVFEKLLSNSIRIMVGHFETNKGKIYSFAYGHPNRNDDYFEYVQITKEEYDALMKQPYKSISSDEAKQIYDKWIKSRKVLCNEFSMNPAKYKPGFKDEEINTMKDNSNKIDKKKQREIRRQHVRELNEPPHLTIPEEVGNAVTHGVGAALAVVGLILLLLKSDTSLKVMASCFYGISLLFMMLMSCLYHSFRSGSIVKRLWRRFDYSSIYLLIGGTFAPLYLVYWGNKLGIILFCIQWGIIALGIAILGIFGPGRVQWIHFTLYFVIGWSGLMFVPDWFMHNRSLFWMILLGGVVYTVGMIPFAKDKKYDHFIWHFFVLAGAVLHWIGIYFFVY